jgi:hypothetical protein
VGSDKDGSCWPRRQTANSCAFQIAARIQVCFVPEPDILFLVQLIEVVKEESDPVDEQAAAASVSTLPVTYLSQSVNQRSRKMASGPESPHVGLLEFCYICYICYIIKNQKVTSSLK